MKVEKIKAFSYIEIDQIDIGKTIESIESNPLIPLTEEQSFCAGFTQVQPDYDSLVLQVEGKVFFKYTELSKSINHGALQAKVDELCETYLLEHQSAAGVPDAIRDEFETKTRKTMLEFAPIKTKSCRAYLDPHRSRLVVLSASPKMSDQIISLLFQCRESPEHLRMKKPQKNSRLDEIFTQWVKQSEAPQPCGLNEKLVITYPQKGKATIQKRHIANQEIAGLVQNGKVCELGLSFVQKPSQLDDLFCVEFTWNDKGDFKAIDYTLMQNALWEQTLALDEQIQMKQLHHLIVEVVDQILLNTEQMLTAPQLVEESSPAIQEMVAT